MAPGSTIVTTISRTRGKMRRSSCSFIRDWAARFGSSGGCRTSLERIAWCVPISVAMIVHPSVPVRTVKELVALARARPGALNFASGGPGSSTHLGVELLKYVAKIDLVHIPYKGTGPAVADVLGGQVTMANRRTDRRGRIRASRACRRALRLLDRASPRPPHRPGER